MMQTERMGRGHAEIVQPVDHVFKNLLRAIEEFDRHTKHVNELLREGFE